VHYRLPGHLGTVSSCFLHGRSNTTDSC